MNLGVNLVRHDRSGRLIGEAAERWTVSSDFKKFEFDLRVGLKDSRGKLLTSADWKATFTHLLRMGGSTHSFISQFLDESGIATPTPGKLLLTLKEPYQTFIQRLTTPEFVLVPESAISNRNEVDLSISSGPYYLKHIDKARQTCTLAANHFYSGYHPGQPEEVILETAAGSTRSVFDNLESGRWQFAITTLLPTDPNAARFREAIAQGRLRSLSTEPGAVAFVLLYDTPRLESPAEKLALAKLLGERAEVELRSFSAIPAHQIYPHGFVGALTPPRENELFSSIRAKASASSLPSTLTGYSSTGCQLYGVPQWVQNALTTAGIKSTLHYLPYAQYQAEHKTLAHDFVVVMTGMNSKDPAGSLLTLLSPKSGIIPDQDGVLNGLLQKAVESEATQRPVYLHAVSEMLIRDGRVIPLMHYGTSVVFSSTLELQSSSDFDDEIRLSNIRWKR